MATVKYKFCLNDERNKQNAIENMHKFINSQADNTEISISIEANRMSKGKNSKKITKKIKLKPLAPQPVNPMDNAIIKANVMPLLEAETDPTVEVGQNEGMTHIYLNSHDKEQIAFALETNRKEEAELSQSLSQCLRVNAGVTEFHKVKKESVSMKRKRRLSVVIGTDKVNKKRRKKNTVTIESVSIQSIPSALI